MPESVENDAVPLIADCYHGCGLLMNAISHLATAQADAGPGASELLYRAVELQKAIATLLERLVRDTVNKHAN